MDKVDYLNYYYRAVCELKKYNKYTYDVRDGYKFIHYINSTTFDLKKLEDNKSKYYKKTIKSLNKYKVSLSNYEIVNLLITNRKQEIIDRIEERKRPKKAKPSFKHWDFNKLLNNIKLYINFIKDDKFNNVNAVDRPAFTAEGLSEQFKAKRKLVDKAIHIIRRDSIPGYYIEESNNIMHDSNRDPRNGGTTSGWIATVYYINKKEEIKND